jgi:hypothetical protein
MHEEPHAYDGVVDVPFLLGFCNGVFSSHFNLWFLTVAGTFRSWRKGRMTFLLILICLAASGIAVCALTWPLNIGFDLISVQHRCLQN